MTSEASTPRRRTATKNGEAAVEAPETSTTETNVEAKAEITIAKQAGKATLTVKTTEDPKAIYLRPTSPSTLNISEKTNIFGERPVTAATLTVAESFYVCGERPIVSSDLVIQESFYQSGERPITSSSLQVADTYSIFGPRPVASNYLGSVPALMGYLD